MKIICLSVFTILLSVSCSLGSVSSRNISSIEINLEKAINMALSYNRELLDFQDALTTSKYSLDSARADFMIQISPGARAGFSGSSNQKTVEDLGLGLKFFKRLPWGTELSATPNVNRTDNTYESSVNFSITQPLLRGFGRQQAMASVDSAKYSLRTARRNLMLAEIDTIIRTVQAVYDCVRLKEELRQNKESLRRLREHKESLLAKTRLGYSPSIDTYRVELELGQAEDAVVQSREALGDSLDDLKMILNIPMEKSVNVIAPLEFSPISIPFKDAINTAFKNRIEMKQAADDIREAKRQSAVAKRDTWPQLDLQVSYGRMGYGGAFSKSIGLDDHYWAISLVSTTDFFRRKEKLAYRQSLLNVRTSVRRYSLIKDEIIRKVKNSIRSLERAWRQIKIQKGRIDSAKGKLELAKVKFRWGKANNFDLIEAEKELRGAQVAFITAVTSYIVGTYKLRKALGTLLEDRCEINEKNRYKY